MKGLKQITLTEARWERRDKKKKNAWYKKAMHSNRKSLEVIIEVLRKRYANVSG